MTRYPTCLRILLTLSIVLIAVSVSEAGPFGRRACYDYGYYSYYYYPACSTVSVTYPTVTTYPAVTVTTSSVPSIPTPAAGQPMASPPAYTVMKPVIDDSAVSPALAAPQPVAIPQSGSYAPAAGSYSYPSGGYSTTPRSSWDFGRFPPYH